MQTAVSLYSKELHSNYWMSDLGVAVNGKAQLDPGDNIRPDPILVIGECPFCHKFFEAELVSREEIDATELAKGETALGKEAGKEKPPPISRPGPMGTYRRTRV